jgi:hypothetical protein
MLHGFCYRYVAGLVFVPIVHLIADWSTQHVRTAVGFQRAKNLSKIPERKQTFSTDGNLLQQHWYHLQTGPVLSVEASLILANRLVRNDAESAGIVLATDMALALPDVGWTMSDRNIGS